MAIEVTCRCGRRFAARPELAGQRVPCPACGAGLVIPRPSPASAPLVVTCTCGRRFQAPPHLAGRQVPCPSCRRPLPIPEAGAAAGLPPAAAQPAFDFDLAAYENSAAASPLATPRSTGAALQPTRMPSRKSNGVNPRIFIIGGAVAGVALVLVVGAFLAVQAVRGVIRGVANRVTGEELPLQDQDYAQFRQSFRTQLVQRGPSPQEGDPLGPCEGWDQVTYLSGGLQLTAYVDRAPADGRPRPAVLYLHGGFAFGEEDLEQAQPYRDAGFVVMVPVLRGENNQPGHFSLFYDEVDDVLAAAEALASLPYVDPDCLCVAGHSAGGTLAMLAAMASPRFRASAAFSGTANEGMLDDEMPELVVFNRADPREVLARSAEAFATSFKCSARLYFGSQEWYFKPQLDRTAQRAKQKGIDVEVMQVPGDHFTMLELAIPQSVQFFRSRVQTGPRMTPESPLSDAPRGTRPPPWEPAPGIPATPGSSSDPSSPPWTRPAPPSFPTPSPSVPTPPSFPMPPGYTPPPWPSRPSPPGRPGEAPPVPRPPLAPSVKPLTLTPTDAVQPPLVAFVMLGYQGTGDPTEAARQALRDVPWADGRVQVDQPGGRILIGVRGSSVSSATAATALQRAGFQLGGVTFRPR